MLYFDRQKELHTWNKTDDFFFVENFSDLIRLYAVLLLTIQKSWYSFGIEMSMYKLNKTTDVFTITAVLWAIHYMWCHVFLFSSNANLKYAIIWNCTVSLAGGYERCDICKVHKDMQRLSFWWNMMLGFWGMCLASRMHTPHGWWDSWLKSSSLFYFMCLVVLSSVQVSDSEKW